MKNQIQQQEESKTRILIVEDDRILAGELKNFLARWGYGVETAEDFEDLLAEFCRVSPRLVLMDINLPYYDGFYWCGRIREISNVPILFISSRGDDRDKIMAMAQGGDDYVEKPFQLELLKAKIEAILRRAYQYQVTERIRLGDGICFDKEAGALFFQGREAELTRSERKILSRLVESRPRVVTREELMITLWSTDEFISDGTLTTTVSRLRSKLKAFCGKELIRTKKGQGYFIDG